MGLHKPPVTPETGNPARRRDTSCCLLILPFFWNLVSSPGTGPGPGDSDVSASGDLSPKELALPHAILSALCV